tara:strand:+ start:12716 stop:12970 length:255 start_codon:yes stop_codon:yes gene_type:complete
MKLEPNKFGLAAALAFAVIWIVCSVIVMLMPDMSLMASGSMLHSNMDNWEWDINVAGILIGLILWSIMAGAIGWLFSAIYNKLI